MKKIVFLFFLLSVFVFAQNKEDIGYLWKLYWGDVLIVISIFLLLLLSYIFIQLKKNFFEVMLDNIAEGIYSVDHRGRCVWINQRALDMLGFKKDEVLKKNQHELFHHTKINGKIYHEKECPVFKTIKDKKTRDKEDYFIKKNGSFFPVKLRVAPLEYKDGAIVIFSDITKEREAKKKLLNAMKHAEESNRAKSMFLANMSHEIRTPLNAVIGLSEIALDNASDQKQKEQIEKIYGSSKSLLGVINDILDYSKIEGGKIELEFRAFFIEEIVENLKNIFEKSARKKGLEIVFDVSDEIVFALVGDEYRLNQILINLLGNAIKFTHEGSVELKIELIDKIKDRAILLFSVKDSGVGISEEERKKLFKPFSQADISTTRKYGGSGLGLVISQKILETFDSQIEIESKPGVGSTFRFALDLSIDTSNSTLKKRSSNKIERKFNIDLSGLNILLVEDNLINQEVTSMMLQKVGAKIEIANDGKEGVEKFLEGRDRYDIILMDIQMPQMSGYEAALKIREVNKKIPIVALTAAAMVEDREKALESGMNDHIGKPIDSDLLYKSIVNLCGKKVEIKKRELNNIEDKNFSSKIYGMFLKELDGKFADIVNQVRENKNEAKSSIHSLKGVSGNVGAVTLHQVCIEIDRNLKEEREVDESLIEELKESIDEIKKELQKELQKEQIIYQKIPKPQLIKLVESTKEKLRRSEYIDSEDIKNISLNLQGEVEDDILECLKKSAETFNYNRALDILENIKIEE